MSVKNLKGKFYGVECRGQVSLGWAKQGRVKFTNGTFSTYDYTRMTLLIVSRHKVGVTEFHLLSAQRHLYF